jgi:hypothetical protein
VSACWHYGINLFTINFSDLTRHIGGPMFKQLAFTLLEIDSRENRI